MGIQTMASQGGGGGVAQRSQIQSLQRQSSLYSLTLGEVQSHLGESLHSMNLEELLKGLDTNQEVNSPRADPYASSSTLQRQGSYTLTQDLKAKTVEEVWRGIQDGNNKSIERQLTFGEMTLEEFLGRAGLVPEGIVKTRNNVVRNNVGGNGDVMSGGQGPHWLHQYHQQNMMGGYLAGRSVPQSLDGMYSEGQMSISSPTVGGAMSDLRTSVRKRGAVSDVADKLVERRQKRMIKNRESAARSRARKQAYTNELENKVSRLEEENERLKKQKELEMILLCAPPPEPKYQLRRTSSATF